MINNLQIQFMTFNDLKEIEPIFSNFDDFWTIQNLKSELENINSKYIVAKIDNTILGFSGIWFSVDDAHITNIVVHKEFRHMGIGSKMLEKLIVLAQESNKLSLTLEVNIKNEHAKSLYLKYGFKQLGVRKKYYKGIDDAFIMTLYF